MRALFADTFYYLALLSADDAAHDLAVKCSNELHVHTVTTAWVLTEVADAFCNSPERRIAVILLEKLRRSPTVTIVPPTQELFDRGFSLYASRPDKDWSLTDCISFVVMQQQGLTEALTGDRHFEQAGFKALLAQEEK
jgi:predicted nucleic acid-binding protein